MVKEKIKLSLLVLVLFQIFILVNLTTAESYLIHQTDKEIEKAVSENKEKEDLVGLGISLLIGVFSIKQIGIVSAIGEQTNSLTEDYNTTTYAVAERTIENINWNCCLN